MLVCLRRHRHRRCALPRHRALRLAPLHAVRAAFAPLGLPPLVRGLLQRPQHHTAHRHLLHRALQAGLLVVGVALLGVQRASDDLLRRGDAAGVAHADAHLRQPLLQRRQVAERDVVQHGHSASAARAVVSSGCGCAGSGSGSVTRAEAGAGARAGAWKSQPDRSQSQSRSRSRSPSLEPELNPELEPKPDSEREPDRSRSRSPAAAVPAGAGCHLHVCFFYSRADNKLIGGAGESLRPEALIRGVTEKCNPCFDRSHS